MEMRTEKWAGFDIRFVESDGEWWAVLKDICDALGLKSFKVAQRLDPNMLTRVSIPSEVSIPDRYGKGNIPRKYNTYPRNTNVLVINELGIYEALFASKKLEARKFRLWAGEVMKKLRNSVGLEGYEVMRMTEPEIQEQIDDLLDSIFYDEETGKLMRSVTVAGGDVEQVEI